MPVSIAMPGVGEARMFALETILKDNIASLNTALSQDTLTSPLVSQTYGGEVLADHIGIGDLNAIWDQALGSCRIRVCSGGQREGQAFSTVRDFIDAAQNRGMINTWSTSIFIYFHSAAFRSILPDQQERSKEIARERASDWCRQVLNHYENLAIVLTSSEFNDGIDLDSNTGLPVTDRLMPCMARVGYKGLFIRGAGNAEYLYGVHILHEGLTG